MARLAAGWEKPVALVPTMGALHAGHLSLIDHARREVGKDGVVVVSIFVNPLQFGPTEDLSRYPRPLQRDLALCRERGVNVVFNPGVEDMYAPGRSVVIDETLLSGGLCGASRPGHFSGVCTVVAKLFNLVRPDVAVFGRKDYQQLAIIQRMVRDLNFPVRIVPSETVREADGLAMSSRNVYLSEEERKQAPVLRRALLRAAEAVRSGETDPWGVREELRKEIERGASLARVDYAEVRDAEDLQGVDVIAKPVVLALAVFFGKTRLIDNIVAETRVEKKNGRGNRFTERGGGDGQALDHRRTKPMAAVSADGRKILRLRAPRSAQDDRSSVATHKLAAVRKEDATPIWHKGDESTTLSEQKR